MTNIANLPPEERNAIQRDKLTALWANDCKHGKANQAGVMRRLLAIKDQAKREDLIARFNKFMNA